MACKRHKVKGPEGLKGGADGRLPSLAHRDAYEML